MKKKPDTSGWQIETLMVRGGTMRSEFGETSEALYLNSGFCYEDAETAQSRFDGSAPGFVYSRYLNPNLAMLEERLALLEGAERCIVTASGMAAVFSAFMCQLKTGDRVVAAQELFSSCHYIITQILPRFGISVELVDGADLSAWEKALAKPTACVFLESPSNPVLKLVDIAAVAKLAHKAGACVIVDNVFAGPLLQRPLELGADVTIYSTTKHMDGQGRTLGGAVLGKQQFIDEVLMPFHRHTGPALSPFNAWLILKSLETYSLRACQHQENALKLAQFLEKHDKIESLVYPGLPGHPQYALAKTQMKGGGAMLAFTVKGGQKAAFRFMNHLRIVDISNNLGDAKSLITHPATTTHASLIPENRQKYGITEGLLRLSVGLENSEDLIADLAQALSAS